MGIETDSSQQLFIQQKFIEKSIYKQMIQKKRPLSSKPVSNIPIMIDQSETQSNYLTKYTQHSQAKGRPKLTHIVPQLRQFGIKSNSTALLYSKFIVKGLKQDKLSVVKSAYRKNKQQVTEACTIYQNRNNKLSNSKFNYCQKRDRMDTFHVQENADSTHIFGDKIQFKTIVRASSAKIFNKPSTRQLKSQSQRQKILLKNRTQDNLFVQSKLTKKRPTTAKNPKSIQARFSHIQTIHENNYKKTQNKTILQRTLTDQRKSSSTNFGQASYVKNLYSEVQANQLLKSKLKDKPIRVEYNKGIDHIQKNIQNVSIYSRKTSSIYLTNANIQNILNKRNNEKEAKLKIKKEQLKQQKSQLFQQIRPQQIFVKADKQRHQKKLFQVEKFLENQMPSKFEVVNKQIRKQQKKLKIKQQHENYQQLLSKDLDNHYEQNHEEINQKGAIACFQDYIRACQTLQYNIASKLKTEQSNNGNNPTLNIFQCKKIIQIYRKLEKQVNQQNRTTMLNQIKDITRKLKYFSHKSEQQINKFFNIPFEIIIAAEDETMVELNSPIEYIYIILNGSALIQTISPQDHSASRCSDQFTQMFTTNKISVYDGEMFGQPTRPSQKIHKSRVTNLQQSLLIKIKYQDYIKNFFVGLQIQQKLQILRLVFRLQLDYRKISEQDLQMISLSLQKQKFPSKTLIFRQGDVFDKIIIVGKGKVSAINQFIIEVEKAPLTDMKDIDKNVRQSRERPSSSKSKNKGRQNLVEQKPCLKNLRRKNLINNEIIVQNRKKSYNYLFKQQKQFVKGDSLNWQAICEQNINKNIKNNNFMTNDNSGVNKITQNSQNTVKFSLMSNADDTEIYLLSKSAFQYLPSNFRKILMNKGSQLCKNKVKIETQKQVKQWNNYKQKLCNQILQDHKLKYNKLKN